MAKHGKASRAADRFWPTELKVLVYKVRSLCFKKKKTTFWQRLRRLWSLPSKTAFDFWQNILMRTETSWTGCKNRRLNIQTWRVYEFNSKPMSPCIGSLNLDNEIRTKITFFSLSLSLSLCEVFINKTKSSRWTLLYSVLCLSDLIEPWSRNFNHFSTNSRLTASNKNLTSIASSVFCQYHLVS